MTAPALVKDWEVIIYDQEGDESERVEFLCPAFNWTPGGQNSLVACTVARHYANDVNARPVHDFLSYHDAEDTATFHVAVRPRFLPDAEPEHVRLTALLVVEISAEAWTGQAPAPQFPGWERAEG